MAASSACGTIPQAVLDAVQTGHKMVEVPRDPETKIRHYKCLGCPADAFEHGGRVYGSATEQACTTWMEVAS